MNPLRQCIADGRPGLGLIISMPSPQMAQVLAHAGLDWLFVDLEHGPIDLASAHAIIAATAGTACAPIVRVAAVERWLAKPVLDAGAMGVIFPMVLNRRDAEEAAAACRYPPQGARGFGPFYAPARWGLSTADYMARADAEVLSVLLIEHAEAIRNLDDILAVPGNDVAQIAPFDLSASLGRPGDLEHPEVQEAIRTAEAKIAASPLALGGLAADAAQANDFIARGYQVVLLGTDVGLLGGALADTLGAIRR